MEVIELSERSHQKMDETEIIKRILSGEKELYEILVRRNNQKLFRVIRTYLKVEAEIEDVMQNAYIKAFSKLYQFKLESSFSTWLIRIAINEALARLKEKSKVYHFRAVDSDKDNPISIEIPDNGQLNPQEKMIGNELILYSGNKIRGAYKSAINAGYPSSDNSQEHGNHDHERIEHESDYFWKYQIVQRVDPHDL